MVGTADTTKRTGASDVESDGATLAGAAAPVQALRPALRRIDSSGLLAGAREIEIDHRGELYRLRCTNKGKLILTK